MCITTALASPGGSNLAPSGGFLEFSFGGNTFRYDKLDAVVSVDRSDGKLDVTIAAGRGLLEPGPRYAIYWFTSADNPPKVGVVTSRVWLGLDVPGMNQTLMHLPPTSRVTVYLTVVTDKVIAGTFTAENLLLVSNPRLRNEPMTEVPTVSGSFQATRWDFEHDG
jgi:hypothetical protein